MDNDTKKFIADLTELLHKHGFNKNEIADIIAFSLIIHELNNVQKDVDDLYDTNPNPTEEL